MTATFDASGSARLTQVSAVDAGRRTSSTPSAPAFWKSVMSTISRADYERIEQLQRAHYRKLVNIIAESEPGECVVLYAAQLLELRGV